MLVHDRGGLRVLERFVGHHMTPVAGGIADAQKDRLILRAGFFERLWTPGIPIDRIIRVLQQVRRIFSGKMVHQTPKKKR
jgi:hypothetical protein